ncbi:MAG: hypothetical protein ABW328_13325 [Ilumatobacteraceae bacterium]
MDKIEENEMDERTTVQAGDVIELSVRGERRTAEVLIVTDDGVVLLDLLDGDRPAAARVSELVDVVVFRPELSDVLVAA